ncbi:MAG: MGMT family protein [Sphingomonas sp.]
MTPSAWKRGGAGVTIRWTVAETSLGPLLIAATDKGLCRVAFDEDQFALARRFPAAEIAPGGAALATLAARVVSEVETPGRDTDLPVDVQGTAFQEAVWQALRAIPAGEDAQLFAARRRGGQSPRGCARREPLAVPTTSRSSSPCHRAQRTDGSMGGYAFGIDRKRALRKREGVKD